MRVGRSENHDQKVALKMRMHRVIIPVYIPHEKDYYKDAFTIFKMCLQSIQVTSAPDTPVTVVANGCSQDIHMKMLQLQNEGLIEELMLETAQLGKINSLRKAIAASDEKYLTISDGDVMFLENWDTSVSTVFKNFPKATAVSPVPVFKTFNQFTSNIWFDGFFNSNLAFESPADPAGLVKFANSIGWSYLNDYHKNTILTLTQNKNKAVVGCSHFCTTYKREALLFAPQSPTQFLLSGNSEGEYLDKPTLVNDGYRLSTLHNHAYHLGNTLEPWMGETMDSISKAQKVEVHWPAYCSLKKSTCRFWIKNRLFKKALTYPYIYNSCIKKFKLPAVYQNHYLKK